MTLVDAICMVLPAFEALARWKILALRRQAKRCKAALPYGFERSHGNTAYGLARRSCSNVAALAAESGVT